MDELDPLQKVELAMLRAEYQKRYQGMVAYLKEQIGPGTEYRNAVARVVIASNGAYCELNDLPEEFVGAAGTDVTCRFVAPAEAISLLGRAVDAIARITPENTRQVSLFALYTRRGIIDRTHCYIYDYDNRGEQQHPAHFVLGQFQPNATALYYKIKLDTDFAPEVLNMPRGIVCCIADVGDRHLLLHIPYSGDQVIDLNTVPTTGIIH